jgi:biotin-(acetyl-CoA carboxylase) ligase
MNQSPNEDTTWMIEVQTETIIQLSNELEAAKKREAIMNRNLELYRRMNDEMQIIIGRYKERIAELERIIEIHQRHDKQLYRIIHNLKDAPNGKD